MKAQKELDQDSLNIQKARDSTRLELRKQKITQIIQDKKMTSLNNSSINNSKLRIDPATFEFLDVDNLSFNSCRTFVDYLNYISASFRQHEVNQLRHAIYQTNLFLVSDKAPKTSIEIEQASEQIFELIKIMDYYSEKDLQIGFELVLIFIHIHFFFHFSLIFFRTFH